ncbi:L type [Durusdinium trenchii]|uniref:L type n=1 Tax=Durusdinium trenchii TaxID=1381693 RepID=A0ABP0KCG5_9DINO
MGAMEKDAFAKLLDNSWQTFRQQLLEAFPDDLGVHHTSSLKSPKVDHHSSFKSRKVMESAGVSEITEIDEDVYIASAAPQTLKSGLKGMHATEALQTSQRLRVRLGAITSMKLVSGQSLHDAVAALGLTRFTVEEMNDFVNNIAEFICLDFVPDRQVSSADGTFESDNPYGTPVWSWPSATSQSFRKSVQNVAVTSFTPRKTYNLVPAQALMELFLAEEGGIHKRLFGPRLMTQFQAMKEILLAGDTNRLVAELTFVRINDLATPPEPTHPLMYIEPFVGLLIVCNGIMIGFQTDPLFENWPGWIWFELAFASILLMEIGLRMHLLRCRGYWWGPERLWNWFDVFLAGTGVSDVTIQIVSKTNSEMMGTSLLRFCRLIRLARIVKVFRLRFMKDLRLMVKGWIAGIRTLALAFTLLFAVLYVISGFAAMTIGASSRTPADLQPFFETIPNTMFTAFRCFTGECVNHQGHSITSLLADEFGVIFILSFVASYMLVTMGIFNVILAVYVDITMKAAKENEAVTAEQYARESIRIARTTRELLKKFAAAHRDFMAMEEAFDFTGKNFNPMPALFTDDDVHEQIEISKELFLVVIQDHSVQRLMDDLDLPPDRANLFEVIDADGSGTLHITELVQGLLKIRGDISKSDTVASLLATKAVQRIVEDMRKETEEHLLSIHDSVRDLTGQSTKDMPWACSEDLDEDETPEQPPPSLQIVLPQLPLHRPSCASVDLGFMPVSLDQADNADD